MNDLLLFSKIVITFSAFIAFSLIFELNAHFCLTKHPKANVSTPSKKLHFGVLRFAIILRYARSIVNPFYRPKKSILEKLL
jgi:hypothetical protein